ncbi:hypothetical protein BGZ70_003945 [Mortierella alpina]|uniref:F-box domain-containing protein n=1 Tax=Mortierella alpina TaxID=64518 RepID=A0A9P6IRM1_MORAP|nr:hypothetical protein BGZ70_003945 [Mortierella alpina]
MISSSNSCLKRPLYQSQCSSPPDGPRVTDQESTFRTIVRASTENVVQNIPERANIRSSKRHCSRPKSLDGLPLEINLMILSKLTHPPDVVRFSHTCSLFRAMANARVWCRLYKILVPHWSTGVEVQHVQGGVDVWRRIVMDDYMRKKLHWAPKSFESEFGMFIHDDDEAARQLRINLDDAITVRPQYLDVASEVKWRNMGPPVSSTFSETKSTITAYVQALYHNGRTDYRIVMFNPSQHETPLAIIPSEFWTQSAGQSDQETQDSFSVAQLMDIKQYPDQRDERIRVVLVIAFGDNNGIERLEDGEGQMNILDTWALVRVVELFVCPTSPFTAPSDVALAASPRLIPDRPNAHRGRVRTFQTESPQEVLRGRAIKVYTGPDPVTKEIQERIAFFGIRSTTSQTVLLTNALFGAPKKQMSNSPNADTFKIKFEVLGDSTAGRSLETSCLALFPPQSDFENLIVIMDNQGQGEIWDWMNIKKVATLEIAGVERRQKQDQAMYGIHQQDPPLQQDQPQESPNRRKDLYYWGIQVNFAVEEPAGDVGGTPKPLVMAHGFRKHGDFRLVALADGQDREWETTWWHISEQELRKALEQVLDQDNNSSTFPVQTSWTIRSNSRHFETSTLGTTRTPTALSLTLFSTDCESNARPTSEEYDLLFVAYLVWDHFRISLTSRFGLCIVDMDKEVEGDVLDDGIKRPPQYVTVLDNAAEDGLVDIATLGDSLLITRRFSHVIWPFRQLLQGEAP